MAETLLFAALLMIATERSSPPSEDPGSGFYWKQINGQWHRVIKPDKGRLLAELDRDNLSDADIQRVFFALRDHNTLTQDEERRLAKFLDADRPATFGVVVSVLAKSPLPEVVSRLRAAAKSPDVFVRQHAASALWAHHRDRSAIDALRSVLLDATAELSVRRELAWHFIDTRDLDDLVLGTYVELLEDREQWLRYNAIMILRRETGSTLGYNYRVPTTDAVKRWRDWLKASSRRIDRSREGQAIAGIGARLSEEFVFIDVRPDFPAARAGVISGDALVAIDGDAVAGKTSREVRLYEIFGKPGTELKLTLRRADRTFDVTLVRQELSWSSAVPSGQ